MKRVAVFSLGWSLAGPPDKQAQEKAQVATLLREIGREKLYNPEKHWYPVDVDVRSRAFEILIKAAQESDLVRLIRIERVYSSEELQAAPLLEWRLTNQAIEDDYYTLHFKEGQAKGIAPYARDCPSCRAHLEQVRDIWVDTRLMGQRDLSLTYSFEIILSARLARMLQEAGFTGFALRPVWDYRKPYQGEPKLYQLVVTNVLPPMASPPTEFEQEQRCEVCGTESRFLKHTHFWGRIQYYEETDIYYAREVLEQATDFNITSERFGVLSASHPLVIISQRVYRWLKEQGIKGWSARPVYLVGSSTLTSE
ncbi:MAG: hypothetical protein KNN16_08210 [Thermoflexus hugenholtzii]|jgi:hypothetical protein|uniref:hypothetical protein n=1 Tax=Thermoflexus TaxID=1495649 RepID=UPI001C777D2E|nr:MULTISPECIES: hypothetical protein [Thermoflexus]QWK09354.1 MAG: hypothetical protein KNN16_08210 [Thermoflexus hugenholtzii]